MESRFDSLCVKVENAIFTCISLSGCARARTSESKLNFEIG